MEGLEGLSLKTVQGYFQGDLVGKMLGIKNQAVENYLLLESWVV